MLLKVNASFEKYWLLKSEILLSMGYDKASVYEIWNDGNTQRIKAEILQEIIYN